MGDEVSVQMRWGSDDSDDGEISPINLTPSFDFHDVSLMVREEQRRKLSKIKMTKMQNILQQTIQNQECINFFQQLRE